MATVGSRGEWLEAKASAGTCDRVHQLGQALCSFAHVSCILVLLMQEKVSDSETLIIVVRSDQIVTQSSH